MDFSLSPSPFSFALASASGDNRSVPPITTQLWFNFKKLEIFDPVKISIPLGKFSSMNWSGGRSEKSYNAERVNRGLFLALYVSMGE